MYFPWIIIAKYKGEVDLILEPYEERLNNGYPKLWELYRFDAYSGATMPDGSHKQGVPVSSYDLDLQYLDGITGFLSTRKMRKQEFSNGRKNKSFLKQLEQELKNADPSEKVWIVGLHL